MLGTQGLQMLSSILIYPSFAQETGGIAIETLEIETARDMFPGASDEDALRAFRMIKDDKVKTKAMLSVIENGQVDFGPAVSGGAAAAGLDIATNFFVLGKAFKFAPKSVLRDFTTKGLKGVLKNKGAQGLLASTGIESITETLQEEIAIRSVESATGYGGDLQENIKRRLESAGQAFLTTPVLTAGGGVSVTAVNEFRARVLNGNRKQARELINKQKDIYDQSYKDGKIDLDTRNEIFTELEGIESMVNNVDVYKKMENDSKDITIKSLIEAKQLEKQKTDLQNQKKSAKENSTIGEAMGG